MKKGSELELVIERLGDRGKSIARADGFVVFVQGGVPGDRVRARIIRKKRQFADAQVLELLEAGASRVEPRCRHFGTCGGCKWQHVAYEVQTVAKRQSIVDAFARIAGLGDIPVNEPIVAAEPYEYRNKMEFSFSASRWMTTDEIQSGRILNNSFAFGLHVPGNFEKVLDLDECHLMKPWVSRLLNEFRVLALTHGWPAWNVRTHVGYLRHLVVRDSSALPEAMVNLVVSKRDSERESLVAAFLKERFPEVTTFVVTLNTALSQTSYGTTETIYGPGYIRDRLGRLAFRITPESFFQTNTRQAAALYDCVVGLGGFTKADNVFDLYCGTGTIALYVADHVARVVGVEVIEQAVGAARTNAIDNGVLNAVFEQGDVVRWFDDGPDERHGRPDAVIVDPPRAGMHPGVVGAIASLSPERIVYVSCNPQTMARDVEQLAQLYTVDRLQPVDMFPHTHHIEAVARLTRRAS